MKDILCYRDFVEYIDQSEQDISVIGCKVVDSNGNVIAKLTSVPVNNDVYEKISNDAISVASQMMNCSREDIISSSRDNLLVIARWLICYHLHIVEGFTTSVAGKAIHRDHATVLHGIKQIKKVMENPKRDRILYHFVERFETRMLNEQEIK